MLILIHIEEVKENNVNNTNIQVILKEDSYRNCWLLFEAVYCWSEIHHQALVDAMVW